MEGNGARFATDRSCATTPSTGSEAATPIQPPSVLSDDSDIPNAVPNLVYCSNSLNECRVRVLPSRCLEERNRRDCTRLPRRRDLSLAPVVDVSRNQPMSSCSRGTSMTHFTSTHLVGAWTGDSQAVPVSSLVPSKLVHRL